jgi:hypothetical protein
MFNLDVVSKTFVLHFAYQQLLLAHPFKKIHRQHTRVVLVIYKILVLYFFSIHKSKNERL